MATPDKRCPLQKATVMQIKKDAIVHSFAEEECAAFADFINNKLARCHHCPQVKERQAETSGQLPLASNLPLEIFISNDRMSLE